MKSFKDTLEKLLSRKIEKEKLPEPVGRLAKGKSITLLEAILLAQINKAMMGDTSSASFLRDTSGNKLKDRVNEEKIIQECFEDL